MSESRLQYRENAKKNEGGFTLIELSIVLVIIGLIVGGILTGQDLIKAAEQRATLAQIEKFNTSINTFRNKYNGIPGDLAEASAVSFGLYPVSATTALCTTVGMVGCGDGNGLVEGAATSGSLIIAGETLALFRHLSDANLIDGSFAATGATAGTITSAGILGADTQVANIATVFPLAKLGRNNFISPASASGINYWLLTGMSSSTFKITASTGVVTNQNNNLTALESYSMDKKVDDGLPMSGSVVVLDAATSTISTSIAAASSQASCNTATAYAVSPGTSLACSLRFRFN